MVDLIGIEPMTSSMPWKRAPSCATGPLAAGLQLPYCLRYGFIRQTLPRWAKAPPAIQVDQNARDREHFGGGPVSKTIEGAEWPEIRL